MAQIIPKGLPPEGIEVRTPESFYQLFPQLITQNKGGEPVDKSTPIGSATPANLQTDRQGDPLGEAVLWGN